MSKDDYESVKIEVIVFECGDVITDSEEYEGQNPY